MSSYTGRPMAPSPEALAVRRESRGARGPRSPPQQVTSPMAALSHASSSHSMLSGRPSGRAEVRSGLWSSQERSSVPGERSPGDRVSGELPVDSYIQTVLAEVLPARHWSKVFLGLAFLHFGVALSCLSLRADSLPESCPPRYINYVGLVGGALCLVCSLTLWREARSEPQKLQALKAAYHAEKARVAGISTWPEPKDLAALGGLWDSDEVTRAAWRPVVALVPVLMSERVVATLGAVYAALTLANQSLRYWTTSGDASGTAGAAAPFSAELGAFLASLLTYLTPCILIPGVIGARVEAVAAAQSFIVATVAMAAVASSSWLVAGQEGQAAMLPLVWQVLVLLRLIPATTCDLETQMCRMKQDGLEALGARVERTAEAAFEQLQRALQDQTEQVWRQYVYSRRREERLRHGRSVTPYQPQLSAIAEGGESDMLGESHCRARAELSRPASANTPALASSSAPSRVVGTPRSNAKGEAPPPPVLGEEPSDSNESGDSHGSDGESGSRREVVAAVAAQLFASTRKPLLTTSLACVFLAGIYTCVGHLVLAVWLTAVPLEGPHRLHRLVVASFVAAGAYLLVSLAAFRSVHLLNTRTYPSARIMLRAVSLGLGSCLHPVRNPVRTFRHSLHHDLVDLQFSSVTAALCPAPHPAEFVHPLMLLLALLPRIALPAIVGPRAGVDPSSLGAIPCPEAAHLELLVFEVLNETSAGVARLIAFLQAFGIAVVVAGSPWSARPALTALLVGCAITVPQLDDAWYSEWLHGSRVQFCELRPDPATPATRVLLLLGALVCFCQRSRAAARSIVSVSLEAVEYVEELDYFATHEESAALLCAEMGRRARA